MKIYFLLSVFCAILLSAIIRGEIGIGDYFRLEKSRVLMQKTISSLELERENLQSEISKLKSSKLYAEKVLKDRYHAISPDEFIIFFNDI